MPYTTNKNMPKIRRAAVQMVRRGASARKVGRYFGYHHTAVMKWMRRAEKIGNNLLETKSSKPRSHPNQLKDDVVRKIVEKRLQRGRYAEAVHQELRNDGVIVSLSSVKRTLDRNFLTKKKSPWKRFHPHQERPHPLKQGDLVEIDTIHRMIDDKKGFAPFHFEMLQSDHGPEFGTWFVSRISGPHRYTRIGKPNDNAHIERFNRTLQEECLDKIPSDVKKINCGLKKYLRYYNYERLHGGISFLTPMKVVPRY